MTEHAASKDDGLFCEAVESCTLPVAEFDHRAHVRLAYIYLLDGNADEAYQSVQTSINRILDHNGVDPTKYHETITKAWVLAVQHFMSHSEPASSFEHFVELNPRLLDSKIMLTHYSEETLFSDEARAEFVEPDLQPIPRHSTQGK